MRSVGGSGSQDIDIQEQGRLLLYWVPITLHYNPVKTVQYSAVQNNTVQTVHNSSIHYKQYIIVQYSTIK